MSNNNELTERDLRAKQLFLKFSSATLNNLEERRLAFAHIDDELYAWLRRLQLWIDEDRHAAFRSTAYMARLNVMWFTLSGLTRNPSTPGEWGREGFGRIDTAIILALVKEFQAAFEVFERIRLPAIN